MIYSKAGDLFQTCGKSKWIYFFLQNLKVFDLSIIEQAI